MVWRRLGFGAIVVAALTGRAAGDDDPAGIELFEEKIRPVLVEKCYKCHSAGADKIESGLLLDTRDGIRQGGDTGPAIVPGDEAAGMLLSAIRREGLEMPPDEPLPESVVADFQRWIELGAPDPRVGGPPAELVAMSREKAREHWAFRRPVRPALPQVARGDWSIHPIDRLLAATHERLGLTPSSPASNEVLLRRVSLDLVGLPPTPAEREAFHADGSSDAYERLVDRLLASPAYGQRWGRHWMDVWRYSDWYGWNQEVRNSQKHIWHWRDWIVDSLNADKPYDRMIQEMLAGDELAPTDLDALRGTGFLARNWYRYDRNFWINDVVEHTGKAFLGLTINCARCHDHKFDPITSRDHYRFRAFFQPHDIRLDRLVGQSDLEQDGLPRAFDARPEEPTYRFIRGNEKHPDTEHPLTAAPPEALSWTDFAFEPVPLPAESYAAGANPLERQAAADAAQAAIAKAREALTQARTQLAPAPPQPDAPAPSPPTENELADRAAALAKSEKELAVAEAGLAYVLAANEADRAKFAAPPACDAAALAQLAARAMRAKELVESELALLVADQALGTLRRAAEQSAGEIAKAQEALAAAATRLATAHQASQSPGEEYVSACKVYPQQSTGRRLALARWITDSQNPLTARVAVNHIWLRHFGRPIVPSVFDFGANGKPPTHPELLDWLAVELVESGWSMKHIHRLIVTSKAYRMQSTAAADTAANLALDGENLYLWRQNPRRMEAEIVRDSVLAVAGRLDASLGGAALDETTALSTFRRSLYYRHTPQNRPKFLELFDGANPEATYSRNESVTPQQSLAMINSRLIQEQGRLLAASLASTAPGDENAFIKAAYIQVLAREPRPDETALCAEFLAAQAALFQSPNTLVSFDGEPAAVAASADPCQRARENLIQVLLNHNEFVTIR